MPASMTQEGERRKRPILRYLRISAFAVSLATCALLMSLWARSYRQVDNLTIRVSDSSVRFTSGLGQIAIELSSDKSRRRWHFMTQPAAHIRAARERIAASSAATNRTGLTTTGMAKPKPTFKFMRFQRSWILFMRHWIPVLATAIFAAVFGIRRLYRFGLRTLLIATTLVAALLGLVAVSS